MPKPIKGQSKDDFIKSCIPVLIKEGKDQKQAVAQCNSIWDQSMKESKHSHDKCMECSQPPVYEVTWAEGMGHAWFCIKHLQEWASTGDGKGEICSCKETKDGQAAKKFGENNNPNIWESLRKKWNLKESFIPLSEMKNFNGYNPSTATGSEILSEDFRFLSECYEQHKAGKESAFKNKEDVIQASVKAVKSILELDEVTFHIDQMKSESIELLRESLDQIIQGGPCVDPPHGELIWKSKQKAVVRLTENEKLENMGLLSSGQLVYGFVRFYPPERMDADEFINSKDDHRMTESELGEDNNKLLIYRVREFIPFETPKQSDSPDVFFKDDERFFESTGMPKNWDLAGMTKDELIKTHARVHDEATQYSVTTSKPPDKGLIGRHKLITSEFDNKKMDHLVLTELDKLSKDVSLTDTIQIKLLTDKLKEGFTICKPFLSVFGESCRKGWDDKLDIHINWPGHDTKFIEMIKFNLQSCLPPELKESINLVSDYKGPTEDFFAFAEIVLRVIPPEERDIIKIKESDISAAALREARINDAKRRQEADQSRQEDAVAIFRFFMRIGHVPGISPPVPGSIDDMIKAVNERWAKDGKFPQIQVNQKFGGTRAQIHREGDKVLILNENGKDATKTFPLIVEEAKKQDGNFIVDVNITQDPKEKINVANVLDAVLVLEDIHNKPLSERRGLLEKLRSGKHFDIADRKLVKSEGDLKIALKNFSNLPGSTGAVIKLWDSKYPLEGSFQKWMKLEK